MGPPSPPAIDFSAPRPWEPPRDDRSYTPSGSNSSSTTITPIAHKRPHGRGQTLEQFEYISEKVKRDPLWLVPQRPAPKPPQHHPPVLLPTVVVSPPASVPESLPVIMQREVHRNLLQLSHTSQSIGQHRGVRLLHHLELSQDLGQKLTLSLRRLDTVARAHNGYPELTAVLPAVGSVLAGHIKALADTARQLPPPRLKELLLHAHREAPALALKLVVDGVPFQLPLALDALLKIEADCQDATTLQALCRVYRALREQAARLPPGGDPRLHLPGGHAWQRTPGQTTNAWLQHANSLWSRSYAHKRRAQPLYHAI